MARKVLEREPRYKMHVALRDLSRKTSQWRSTELLSVSASKAAELLYPASGVAALER